MADLLVLIVSHEFISYIMTTKLIGAENPETYWSGKAGKLLERKARKLIGEEISEAYWIGKHGNLLE